MGHTATEAVATKRDQRERAAAGGGRGVTAAALDEALARLSPAEVVSPSGAAVAGSGVCTFAMLRCDVNGDSMVNPADANKIKPQIGQPVTAATARYDTTADGVINLSDALFAKACQGLRVMYP